MAKSIKSSEPGMNVKQIAKNAASNYGRMIVGMSTALFLTPFLLKKLGLDAYGVWGLSQAVGGYFGLLDFGVTSATVRYISHYRALNDTKSLNEVVQSSFFCYVIVSMAVLVLSLFLACYSPQIFPKSSLHNELQHLICIVGVTGALGFLSVLPIQCVIAAQRQDLLNKWMLGFQIIAALATFIFVASGAGVIALAYIQLATGIYNGVIGLVLMRKLMPEVKLRPQWVRKVGVTMLTFAGWSFVCILAGQAIYFSDNIVIGNRISVAAVATYMISFKIVEMMRALVNAGASVVGTFASEQAALGSTESLAAIWMTGSKWALHVAIPAWLACVLLPGDLISSWVGFSDAKSELALMWLASSAVFDLAQSISFQVTFNVGKHRAIAFVMGVEAFINVTLSIWLAPKYGIAGVAFATFVPCFIRSILFYPIVMSRLTKLHLVDYLGRSIAPGILLTLPTCALIAIYRFMHLHSGRSSMIALVLSCFFHSGCNDILFRAQQRDTQWLTVKNL